MKCFMQEVENHVTQILHMAGFLNEYKMAAIQPVVFEKNDFWKRRKSKKFGLLKKGKTNRG